MLKAGPEPVSREGSGRKPVIASLQVPLHQGAVMIPVALGAIGGLYSFFHGFSILQQQRPLPVSLPAKSTVHVSKPVVEAPKNIETPKVEPRTEVIQLTPESSTTSSVLMTQQGKIAAAMLKAGIPSPATWTDESSGSGVRVADPPRSSAALPSVETKVVMEPVTSTFKFPGVDFRTTQRSAKRRAMLLIWGGPALTLACVYFLAAHLGWL